MKKLFWEDVPNPKNCSWAQGVNFQKVGIPWVLPLPLPRGSACCLLGAELDLLARPDPARVTERSSSSL